MLPVLVSLDRLFCIESVEGVRQSVANLTGALAALHVAVEIFSSLRN